MDGQTHISKYAIVQRLGTGGMAEVFKCRLSGVGGFEKTVVIKKILPHLMEDESFVSMFLDEARIAANLTHPNIVQVFEIAQDDDGTPFIAMEYVRGPTLSQLIKKAAKEGGLSAPRFARLIAGAALGLEYAHNARGPEGAPLNIVHRDISPQNIIVSIDGTPKILDFGVAKADGRLTHTQGGVVKGKLRFMAPEQIRDPNGDLDRRADVFALGVCLYVSTTGHLPFSGDSDVHIMQAITSGSFQPPHEFVPGFPTELEHIIDWAMKPDREQRCPSAKALADELMRWVSTGGGGLTDDLPKWLAGLFPEIDAESWGGGVKTPSGVSSLGRASGASRASGLLSRPSSPSGMRPMTNPGLRTASNPALRPSSGSAVRPPPQAVAMPDVEVDIDATGALPPGFTPASGTVSPAGPQPAPGAGAPKSKVGLAVAGVVGLVAVAAGVGFAFRSAPPPAPPVAAPAPAPAPALESVKPYLAEARRLLDEGKSARAREQLERARGYGKLSAEEDVQLTGLESELRVAVSIDAAERALADGNVDEAQKKLQAIEPGERDTPRVRALQAHLDEKLAAATPPSPAPAPAPAPSPNAKTPARPAGRPTPLAVTSEPSGATVLVDGSEVGTTPLSNASLSPGAHAVELRKKDFQPSSQSVTAAGKPLSLTVRLVAQEPAAPVKVAEVKTHLVVTASVRARVSIDGVDVGDTPVDTEALKPGRHTVALAAAGYQPSSRELVLSAGEKQNASFELQKVEAKPEPVAAPVKAAPQAPSLPKSYAARTLQDLAGIFRRVEMEAAGKGGLAASQVRGTTSVLGNELAQSAGAGQAIDVYPAGMYWFIVRGALAGKAPAQLAKELKTAHYNGDLENLAQ